MRRSPSSIPVTAVNNYDNTISSSLIDIPKGTIRSTSALLDPGIEDSLSYDLPPFDIKTTPNGNNEINQPSGPGSISGPPQSCKEGTCGGNNTEYMSFINKWSLVQLSGNPPSSTTPYWRVMLAKQVGEALQNSNTSFSKEPLNRLFVGETYQLRTLLSPGFVTGRISRRTMEEACKMFPPGGQGADRTCGCYVLSEVHQNWMRPEKQHMDL